jgi:lambda family phage portal protein
MINQIRSLFKEPALPEFVPPTRGEVVLQKTQKTSTKTQQRAFSAGKTGLKTASWLSQDISLNALLESQLPIIRARSRELARNTSTGRRYLSLVKNNVVGADGFRLQSRCGDYRKGKWELDDLANQTIERHFKIWCRAEHCDITGQSTFSELTRLLAGDQLARDGEILVREIIGTKDTPYRYQLQVLNVERLDIHKRGTAENGNTIRMGVERNSAGKPVAYYVLARNPNDTLSTNTQISERILANEIIHRFVRVDPEQVRGVPWAHAIMTGQNMLNLFEEAAVEAAVVGATNMGFFKPPAPGDAAYSVPDDGMGAESELADEVAEDGTLMQDAVGASFRVMPEGWDMVKFDPDYPHAAFDPFVQSRKRDIAAGLDVAHHNLSGDMSGVNYSSARIAELGERDGWRAVQKFLINAFAQRVAERWVEISLLANALTMPNGSALPAVKVDKFKEGLSFTARGWDWVDPLKEVNAAKIAIEEGLGTRTQTVASKGGDFEDNVIELAREMALLKKNGVILGDVNKQPVNAQKPADEPANENNDGADDE